MRGPYGEPQIIGTRAGRTWAYLQCPAGVRLWFRDATGDPWVRAGIYPDLEACKTEIVRHLGR